MQSRARIVFTLIIINSTIATSLHAQGVPPGVRYKPASDAINDAATALLRQALDGSRDTVPDILNDTFTCGPMLWGDLKPTANATLLQSKVVDLFLQIPEVVHLEARGFVTTDQRRAFWSAYYSRYPDLKHAQIRKAAAGEISYYWSTISFDIEEPLLVIDSGSDRFVANFLVKNGAPSLFWLDRIGDLRTLGAKPLPARNADTAAAEYVKELNLPEGWRRHSFKYDDGLTLSVQVPGEPREFSGTFKTNTTPPITMDGRQLVSGSKDVVFIVFYISHLSRAEEQLSDPEKTAVLGSIMGPQLNGMIAALTKQGIRSEPKYGKPLSTTLSGFRAFEQEASMGPWQARARAVLNGKYAYAVLVFWQAPTPESMPAMFLNSFRIE
jgi:hypothetical protein